jgi:hypothetical protein
MGEIESFVRSGALPTTPVADDAEDSRRLGAAANSDAIANNEDHEVASPLSTVVAVSAHSPSTTAAPVFHVLPGSILFEPVAAGSSKRQRMWKAHYKSHTNGTDSFELMLMHEEPDDDLERGGGGVGRWSVSSARARGDAIASACASTVASPMKSISGTACNSTSGTAQRSATLSYSGAVNKGGSSHPSPAKK